MRFLDACMGAKVDTTPVWIMRQAGRYLPEYRRLREGRSFLELCKTPGLAVEATLQPMRRFDLDAAIIFSDILVPLEAMGVPVVFKPEPSLPRPVRTRSDVEALGRLEPRGHVAFLLDSIGRVRRELAADKALIGFCGAPFTLATYLVEGGGSRDHVETRAMMFRDPGLLEDLLYVLADSMADYLCAQVEAGADAVQVFDSWAGSLNPRELDRFAVRPAAAVVERVAALGVPVIYFAHGASASLDVVQRSGAAVVGVDHRIELSQAIRRLGPGQVVQGNLDPAVMLGPAELVRARAGEVTAAGREARGHVFNLGHGIIKTTPVENVEVLVEAVHRAGTRKPDA